jgi:hypothetical protein
MELNDYDKVLGVITTADVVEGRFVVLTSHTFNQDFGSSVDLPGVKIPSTAEEAKRARYCITWKIDNRQTPIYAVPQMNFATRGGFDQAANAPFATTVYLTHPGQQEGLTIPSGNTALAFTEGTFTLPSGSYVYSQPISVPGCLIMVCDTASDGAPSAGKPKALATDAVGAIGETVMFDGTNSKLTIKVY